MNTSRYCVVHLAGQRLALDAKHVRQVVTLETLTPVPRSNPLLMGVFPLQGRVLPLFDLSALLGLNTNPGAHTGLMVVCEHEDQHFAVLVATVEGFVATNVLTLQNISARWSQNVQAVATHEASNQAGVVMPVLNMLALCGAFSTCLKQVLPALLPSVGNETHNAHVVS